MYDSGCCVNLLFSDYAKHDSGQRDWQIIRLFYAQTDREGTLAVGIDNEYAFALLCEADTEIDANC